MSASTNCRGTSAQGAAGTTSLSELIITAASLSYLDGPSDILQQLVDSVIDVPLLHSHGLASLALDLGQPGSQPVACHADGLQLASKRSEHLQREWHKHANCRYLPNVAVLIHTNARMQMHVHDKQHPGDLQRLV